MGSDLVTENFRKVTNNFNPRSPCGERLQFHEVILWHPLFQSTLPVWGATIVYLCLWIAIDISIHAPRVGSDELRLAVVTQMYYISIHAPRVGSDYYVPTSTLISRDFNPRSPCGERHTVNIRYKFLSVFQSTLPVWGAT